MQRGLVSTFTFSETVRVEFSNDNESVLISFYNIFTDKGKDPLEHTITLRKDEIDLFIAALQFYKGRIREPKGEDF